MRTRRWTPARTGALALLVVCLTVVAALAAVPVLESAAHLPWVGQGLMQAAAAAACVRAGRVAAAPGRRVWILLAAGQALWALTDMTHGLAFMAGVDVPVVSVFDALWLAYYLPTLAAVGLLYRLTRPEPGWLGAVDALVLTAAASLACWVWLLRPIAAAGAGGTPGTVVNSLYPALDLLGLCIVGWLTVSRRATPGWTVLLTGFFGVAVVAGLFYMHSVLTGSAATDGASGVLYAASSLLLILAARRRRLGGELARISRGRTATPPTWSIVLPFAPVLPLAAMLLEGHPGAPDRLAVAIILLVVGRLCWSLLLLGRLSQGHQALMRVDPMTGAHNRLFLAEELGRLTSRARRGDAHLSALTLDLDGFKAANDTLGHAAGDALLVRLVDELRSRLRDGDVLCRLGGDEFLALLPATDAHGAVALAARLLDGLEQARAAVCPRIPVTGSIGVASARGAEAVGEDLLHRADEAMYAAKRAGGARVVTWRPGLESVDAEPGAILVSGG